MAAGRSDYAADIGARVVNFYGDYFGVDYALPKMDMCVQPSMGGAMENWGLGERTTHVLSDKTNLLPGFLK